MRDYCFEIYTVNPETKEGGWDIVNVIVPAISTTDAREKIKKYPLFDCIITMNDWFHLGEMDWPVWDGEKQIKDI